MSENNLRKRDKFKLKAKHAFNKVCEFEFPMLIGGIITALVVKYFGGF
ncbi:TPA: hypothetical protein ACOAY7_002870 [Vibrio cholerae]|nr:hypothetical protein TUST1-191_00895 [Vibrio phage ICP1_2006_D]ADX88452.1 hypothetical protein TUST1-182_00895 [Vibrio phage ICP1_2006_C]ADX89589.1 hypothetical protein TUST1-10_00885 [Vibrio phage ICP1_2004_A]ASV41264.1 hypothetical protein [Vibrio phage JSF5]QFR59241.1 hypothetical protein ICP12017FMathbaria_181 [Vibrio phage ICP1_2017_F_Mathbaria]QVV97583.1 hypothetical protein 2017DRC106_0910 [Vibrio phage ICP1]HAS2540003.1 hypothetical protein [Vibrio cholerae]